MIVDPIVEKIHKIRLLDKADAARRRGYCRGKWIPDVADALCGMVRL